MAAKRMHMITRKAFMFEIFVFIIASSLPLLFIGAMHDISKLWKGTDLESSHAHKTTLVIDLRVHSFVLLNKTTLKSTSACIVATSCYIYIYKRYSAKNEAQD